VRRCPGFAAWAGLFVIVGLVAWIKAGVPIGQLFVDANEVRARQTVASVLNTIKPRVRIDNVEVLETGPGIAAMYYWPTRTITIDPGVLEYSTEEEFLALVSHEVVHAMFFEMDWGDAGESANWRSFIVPHETAAEVLGAHIAGMVWIRMGNNGRSLTNRLIHYHRELCDTSSPKSYYQQFARQRAEFGLHAVNEEWEWMVFEHVTSTDMVDDINRICEENPDPWDAVRAIGEKYLLTEKIELQTAEVSSGGQ
jgi:hypothetical protein